MRELPWLKIGATGALIAVIGTGVGWYILGKRLSAKSLPHAPISILVGDFANHTGDPVLDNTLEPMLGVAMEGASFINVYSRGDARKLAKKLPNPTDVLDEQSSRLVALNQGVNAIITGDITLRGDQYDISAVALDTVSGKVLAKADVNVTNKQAILSELPKLAVPIRKALGDTTPASLQFDKVSGGFTAASLEAVHQDALGGDEQFAGKFQEAFDSFQKSAELDPKFARAYSGMAAMAQNLGRPGDAVKYMKMAMDNVDRMTERERYRNQGLYYLTLGEWQNCVQQFTQLVARYPADRVGQNNLATCYTQLRDAPKALEAAQHAVEIVPRGVGPRLNLAFISAFAGDFASSEKEARAALEINPSAQISLVLAEAQLGQGQIKEAATATISWRSPGSSVLRLRLTDWPISQATRGIMRRLRVSSPQRSGSGCGSQDDGQCREEVRVAGERRGVAGTSRGGDRRRWKGAGRTVSLRKTQFLAANIYVDAGDLLKAQKLAASLSAQAIERTSGLRKDHLRA